MKAADALGVPPVERLRGLIAALLAGYEGADALHKVQINELSALPMPRQQELKAYERRMVDLFASALRDINPSLAKGQSVAQTSDDVAVRHDQLVLPLVPAGGPMSRAAYANLVTQIIVDGIARLGTDSPARIRLRSKVTSL